MRKDVAHMPTTINDVYDVKGIFARRLKSWRKSKRLPLKAIAVDLGLSESALCQWENGVTFPSPGNLTLIAQYAKLPPCHFFCPEPVCALRPITETKNT
jgi:transcriptional regulator with XRE-family HTH domain